MKKLILFLLIFAAIKLSAQQYTPFPTNNAEWNIKFSSENQIPIRSTVLLKY